MPFCVHFKGLDYLALSFYSVEGAIHCDKGVVAWLMAIERHTWLVENQEIIPIATLNLSSCSQAPVFLLHQSETQVDSKVVKC